ncbi:MAG: hypothetical protein AB7N76_05170 [Planctomycetota bacterium]
MSCSRNLFDLQRPKQLVQTDGVVEQAERRALRVPRAKEPGARQGGGDPG